MRLTSPLSRPPASACNIGRVDVIVGELARRDHNPRLSSCLNLFPQTLHVYTISYTMLPSIVFRPTGFILSSSHVYLLFSQFGHTNLGDFATCIATFNLFRRGIIIAEMIIIATSEYKTKAQVINPIPLNPCLIISEPCRFNTIPPRRGSEVRPHVWNQFHRLAIDFASPDV